MDRAGKFWRKVAAEPGIDGCWLWQGAVTNPPRGSGYGRVKVNGRFVMATRFIWELERGPIPPGMQVCHHCDTPLCVRPNHLFLGSARDNAADMRSKGRQSIVSGQRNPRAVLSAEDVSAIRARYWAGGITQKALGVEYGITSQQVSKIIRGVAWVTS